MPSRPREISSLGIYHVIFRGVAKQIIFEYDDDYGKFLTVLRKYQPICGYKIIAYCLMSNHVHLLIKPGEIPLDRIFQRIIPSFVYWYNKKYIRVGSLFQARFRSTPINNLSQFFTVIRYIHQNPIKAAICDHPSQYRYSSYKKYFDDDLIDDSFVRSEVSAEFFNKIFTMCISITYYLICCLYSLFIIMLQKFRKQTSIFNLLSVKYKRIIHRNEEINYYRILLKFPVKWCKYQLWCKPNKNYVKFSH